MTLPRHCAALIAALVLTCGCSSNAADTAGFMPQIKAESLAEVAITLPQGLPAPRTLVMMGFEFDHQKVMDAWLEKMNLRQEQRPWVQLHGISRGYGLISGFINSRKRPFFTDPYQRERVIPVYTDVDAMLMAMGLPQSRKAVYLAVVKRDGQVMAWAQGEYDANQAQSLREALDAPD
jgi:hypothetical protein